MKKFLLLVFLLLVCSSASSKPEGDFDDISKFSPLSRQPQNVKYSPKKDLVEALGIKFQLMDAKYVFRNNYKDDPTILPALIDFFDDFKKDYSIAFVGNNTGGEAGNDIYLIDLLKNKIVSKIDKTGPHPQVYWYGNKFVEIQFNDHGIQVDDVVDLKYPEKVYELNASETGFLIYINRDNDLMVWVMVGDKNYQHAKILFKKRLNGPERIKSFDFPQSKENKEFKKKLFDPEYFKVDKGTVKIKFKMSKKIYSFDISDLEK